MDMLSGRVFVSFNYRVGRLGFFAHPELTREDPSTPLGNHACMDQMAAQLDLIEGALGSGK